MMFSKLMKRELKHCKIFHWTKRSYPKHGSTIHTFCFTIQNVCNKIAEFSTGALMNKVCVRKVALISFTARHSRVMTEISFESKVSKMHFKQN